VSELADALAGATVVICCGSGGVGKTTTAAVLGLDGARRGHRVVVVTIDPARRLADALGLAGGLGSEPSRIADVSAGGDGTGELWAMMLDTTAMFDQVVRDHAADEAQAERILQNRFYRNIAGALSGTQEYMASEALHRLHGDARFDLVVVDTPPSRNALDFLEAPGVLARFLDHRLFRLLMLPTRGGLRMLNAAAQPMLRAVGRVVGSDVLADAVAFFQAFGGMEGGFRERAEQVMALLRSPETRYVLIASPRRDTVVEGEWFAGRLHEHGLRVTAVVVNRVHPTFGDGSADDARAAAGVATASGDGELAALWANLAELRTIAAAERAEIAPLRAAVGAVPVVEVPLLDDDVHDLAGLEQIAAHLAR
jgi:anion-transporting  ArsA/GET3 family ATPase